MTVHVLKVTDTAQKAEAIALRWRVFVSEQNIDVTEEFDAYDKKLPFFIAYNDDKAVGMARVKVLEGNIGKIERFGVDQPHRGTGVGRQILDAALKDLSAQGVKTVKLSAQVHAIPFYEKTGFSVCSDTYMDAGIPHKDMILEL